MSSGGKSNLERFLGRTSPIVSVHYHAQTSGPSSSSVAPVRRPHIVLRDIWSSYEEWSCFGVGVPLSLENVDSEVTHHYAPSLSAIQIFTIKPFADSSSSSSSSSSSIGKDGTETKCANPNSFSNYKHAFLQPDRLGYLYFQFNETTRPFERKPLTQRITEFAKQHNGLFSLTSLDISPYSWISVAWYPIYPVPSVKNRKELSACFLTYHSLKPHFPETSAEEDSKGKGHGMSSTREVVLPPFGVMTYKAFGNAWIMPGTLDHYKIEMHEESASSWVDTLGFTHSDLNFFMSRKFYGKRH